MAISLNNHETRIKKLEESGVSTWQKGSNENGYWAKETTTGLIIQWGVTSTGSMLTRKFPIAFTSTPMIIQYVTAMNNSGLPYAFTANTWSVSSSGYSYNERNAQNSVYRANWIAIGYLISDRILNYIYKAFAIIFTLIFGIRLVSKFSV